MAKQLRALIISVSNCLLRVNELKCLIGDPDYFIEEYVANLRNQIDDKANAVRNQLLPKVAESNNESNRSRFDYINSINEHRAHLHDEVNQFRHAKVSSMQCGHFDEHIREMRAYLERDVEPKLRAWSKYLTCSEDDVDLSEATLVKILRESISLEEKLKWHVIETEQVFLCYKKCIFEPCSDNTNELLGEIKILPGVFRGVLNRFSIEILVANLKARKLCLDNMGIESIRANTFVSYTSLQFLDLSQNELTALDGNVFCGMHSLKELHLNGNKLTCVEARAFEHLPRLETLNLSENQIQRVESKAFERLAALRLLYMSTNRIKRVDSSTFHGLSSLVELDLRWNALESLPSHTFQALVSLQHLFLANNKYLRHIERDAFRNLAHLDILWIEYTSVKSLDRHQLHGLSALKIVNYSWNQLEGTLDPAVFQSAKATLERILLNDNALSAVHVATFKGLCNLQFLDLSHNSLRQLDKLTFQGLTRLSWLNLSFNQFDASPFHEKTFQNLPELRMLDLSNASVSQLPKRAFAGCAQLEKLYLNSNELREIDAQVLSGGLVKLRLLSLKCNKLEAITGGGDDLELPCLEELDLYNNKLKSLEAVEPLPRLTALKVLNVWSNNFTAINIKAFEALKHLQKVYVSNLNTTNYNKLREKYPSVVFQCL